MQWTGGEQFGIKTKRLVTTRAPAANAARGFNDKST